MTGVRRAHTGSRAFWAGTFLAALLLGGSAARAEPLLRTVALQSEYAPGTNNRFAKFISPIIDDAGRVAFAGELNSDFDHDEGLWSEYQGVLQLMVRERFLEPSPAPSNSFRYSNWQVYGDGRLAFSPTQPSFVQGGPGAYQTAARAVSYDRLTLNEQGDLAYVTADGNHLFRTATGNDQTLASVGDTLPGMAPNVAVSSFGLPAFNDEGDAVFAVGVNDASGPARGGGIWKSSGNTLAPVAVYGQTAPGAPDGRRFNDFRTPAINGVGDVAFQAGVEGWGENGLWRTNQGQLEMVAYRHQAPPGITGDIDFDYFGEPTLNSQGDVVFQARLKGDLPNPQENSGVWSLHEGKLRNIVYAGMPAPGFKSGLGTFASHSGPQINDSGHVVFTAMLSEGLKTPNAIFAYSVTGDYLWSIRDGEQIEVADGDYRTIQGLTFTALESSFGTLAGNPHDGRRSALNDAGQLVFQAYFDDWTAGVFVIDLPAVPSLVESPEPASYLLLVLGGVGLVLARRRLGVAGKEHGNG